MVEISLIKYIYMLRIQMKQSINVLSKNTKIGFAHYKDPQAFIEYSNNIQDVYKIIQDYNPDGKAKVLLLVSDDEKLKYNQSLMILLLILLATKNVIKS